MAQKQMKLWELAAAENQRVFSPYVWAVKLVLDAKVSQAARTAVPIDQPGWVPYGVCSQALEYKKVPWHYHQKDLIKPSQTVRRGSGNIFWPQQRQCA